MDLYERAPIDDDDFSDSDGMLARRQVSAVSQREIYDEQFQESDTRANESPARSVRADR